MLVPADRVHRRHGGVYQAVVGEHAHRYLRVEYLLDLILAHALFLESTIAVGLTHGAIHDSIDIFRRQVLGERRIRFLSFLVEESLLQCLHMFAHSLFGILLHTRVDGGIDAQTILVEVVRCAIRLVVLLAETIERIFLPLAEVNLILQHVPLGVVALLGLFSRQHLAQILAEIGGNTLLVIHRLVLEFDRQSFERIAYLLGDIIVFTHLIEHRIAAVECILWTTTWVVERRVLTHTYQHGCLFELEFSRRGAEIYLCS